MRGRQMPVLVLNEMQVLDQQVAAARLVTEQRGDLGGGLQVDLPALRRLPGALASSLAQFGRPYGRIHL